MYVRVHTQKKGKVGGRGGKGRGGKGRERERRGRERTEKLTLP